MALKRSIIRFLDKATLAVATVDYPHHEIHDGSHFYIKGYVQLDNGVDLDFCVTTPDSDKWSHMLFSIQGTAITILEVYEGSSYSDAGSAVTAINNNRNSDKITTLAIATERTVSAIGTKIEESRFGTATTPVSQAAGSTDREDEIILKRNTNYTFRLISGTDGNIIDYKAAWYDHTSKG